MSNNPVFQPEPVAGQTYLADGWVYRDLPQMTPEYFDKLVGILGNENVVWLTMAERRWPDGTVTKRGQLLISPAGIANLRANADVSRLS